MATPVVVRSLLVLEMASELVTMSDWPHKQARLTLRDQGAEDWGLTLFASDSPSGIEEVARGESHLAILNPGTLLTLALRGNGPFKEPVPVRAITVLHSYDQLAFAVTEASGITSLDDVRRQRYPLRIALRGQQDHSIHLVVNEVLAAAGFSLDDVVSWGGEVRYEPGLPRPARTGAVERGEVDCIIDEAVEHWVSKALEIGMRVLPLPEDLLQRLEGLGFRRGTIEKARYPGLPSDVPSLDFSGFTVYTHADVANDVVRSYCAALEARKDRIPQHQHDGPLPLDRMCKDDVEGPLSIPLHPGAEQFWRERGYLS